MNVPINFQSSSKLLFSTHIINLYFLVFHPLKYRSQLFLPSIVICLIYIQRWCGEREKERQTEKSITYYIYECKIIKYFLNAELDI